MAFDFRKYIPSIGSSKSSKQSSSDLIIGSKGHEMEARAYNYNQIFTISYDGEKTPGEVGSIKRYVVDHYALTQRAWQLFLDSDIVQDVINKYIVWVVGVGLKLQAEPVEDVIGGAFNREEFTKSAEARFRLWSYSRESDRKRESHLHEIAWECLKNVLVGGDCLVVLRVEKGGLSVSLIDGDQVLSPPVNTAELKAARSRGNKVVNGIEMNKRGEHVAYFVRRDGLKYERILARGRRSGRRMAFLVYGLKYRIRNNRGIPLISAILENVTKVSRYKEAAVGSAEEVAKVPYFVEHNENSTGENVFKSNIQNNLALTQNLANKDNQGYGQVTPPGHIATTSQKQVYNMPVGATVKSIKGDQEIKFNDFFMTNFNILCAAVGIPPEVAMSKYDSNFSASRAALKDWENTITVSRQKFADQFYKPIYNLFLELEGRKGAIDVGGMLTAIRSNDTILKEAYRNCRWTGSIVPNVDPLKEVNAIRKALGPLADKIPLTTVEKATEMLNGGDFQANLEKFQAMLETLPEEMQAGNEQTAGEGDGDGDPSEPGPQE